MPQVMGTNRTDGFWWCSWNNRASGIGLQVSGEAEPDARSLKPLTSYEIIFQTDY